MTATWRLPRTDNALNWIGRALAGTARRLAAGSTRESREPRYRASQRERGATSGVRVRVPTGTPLPYSFASFRETSAERFAVWAAAAHVSPSASWPWESHPAFSAAEPGFWEAYCVPHVSSQICFSTPKLPLHRVVEQLLVPSRERAKPALLKRVVAAQKALPGRGPKSPSPKPPWEREYPTPFSHYLLSHFI